MTRVTFPSGQDWDRDFKPYAEALGFLVRDWNDAQETMCDLFCALFQDEDKDMARAVWYAIPNDRGQRKILNAATLERFGEEHHVTKATAWVIGRADALGNQRDDAVHSPVSLMIGDPPEIISGIFRSSTRKHAQRQEITKRVQHLP
jgi:hypothetical protein